MDQKQVMVDSGVGLRSRLGLADGYGLRVCLEEYGKDHTLLGRLQLPPGTLDTARDDWIEVDFHSYLLSSSRLG
jgi:hypothetical protein